MDTGLDGKIVLITGSAQGIGRATALAFAREGARLALMDIDAEGLASLKSEAEAVGASAAVARTDLATSRGIDTGVDAVLEDFGGQVDMLINNVGSGAIRTFDQLTDEDWDKTLQLNFLSYVPVLFVSAKSGFRTDQILPTALRVNEARSMRISTSVFIAPTPP